MLPSIRTHDSRPERFTRELCFITELSNSADDEDLSVALVRVQPGVTTRWHLVTGSAERYVILSGEGVVEIGDLAPRRLGPNDAAIIPPRCRQRIRNSGQADLVFLALCTPRYRPESYVDIE